MEYLTINYSLNRTFNVHKDVFLQIINKVIKPIRGCKIVNEPNMSVIGNGESINIELEIKVQDSLSVFEKIKEITTEIENYSIDIINSKPKNIKIILKSRYN